VQSLEGDVIIDDDGCGGGGGSGGRVDTFKVNVFPLGESACLCLVSLMSLSWQFSFPTVSESKFELFAATRFLLLSFDLDDRFRFRLLGMRRSRD
jgi:hypothetical protein